MTTPNKAQVKLSGQDRIAIERALYQKSFVDFAQAAWNIVDPNPLVWNWHLEALCEHLQAVADGKIRRLVINIPPATAKSMVTSVLFPAWMWTHTPSWRALSTSHSLDRAIGDTRKSRDLIKSEWFQERWPIAFKDDSDRKSGYENTQLGFRVARPFTSLTGDRGNCVIVDDPHSVDGAKSEAERTGVVETFLESVPSRLNNPISDVIIVIMQRLNELDVTGVILAKNLGYEHLCIPMEYEKPAAGTKKPKTCIGWSDPRNREGELLFPQRIPRSKVNEYKESLGQVAYAGQHQQRPYPKNAGILKREWFKRFKAGNGPADYPGYNFYMTSDHAPGGRGDYNVIRVWAIDHLRNLYLVDSFREKCNMERAFGLKRVDGKARLDGVGALPMVKRWKPLAFFPERDLTWQSNEALFMTAMRETGVFVRIIPQPHGGADKEAKVSSYQALATLGQIHLPEGPIGDAALDEYVRFIGNGSKHDDQVDADGMIARVFDQLIPGWIYKTDEEEDVIKGYGLDKSDTANDSDSFWS